MESRLIVGLGNIGDSYNMNRHNIGFIFTDILTNYYTLEYKKTNESLIAETKINNVNILFLKPTTYMNNSGIAVKKWKDWLKIENFNILVICDDIHTDIGNIRFRTSGSSGGHNGLKNIETNIGNDYLRLKIGIGNNYKYGEQADYVLSNFSDEEFSNIMKNKKSIIDLTNNFIKNEDIIKRIENINNILSKRVISSVG